MASSRSTSDPSRCGGAAPVSISLPVVKMPRPRPRSGAGRRSRWRWTVLITIQVLMIVHVIQWVVMGTTTTPIEPSEAMAAVKDGIINMGAIFFGLALLSTAIFGRWVCGWACHVVLLQDGCAAILKRIGIRPKPFRSRLLLWLPLLLALYMFVWPLVYRFAIAPWTQPDLSWPGWQLHLTTDAFWSTFPGVLLAIPFLGICGFLAVYLLGSKGYCTYGCPYGGFFAPLDEVAPVRIRVTDACEHCGHCTAVCTSNVRVHDEVRDFGMVVDPGCMKCMDCVDVCPNDALYVGFGRPASGAKPRVELEQVKRRKWDLSWPEEIVIAAIAALSLFAMRGTGGTSLYGLFPLLMASGVAICVTWIVWQGWRLLRGRTTHLHGLKLRAVGQRGVRGLRPGGWAYIVATVVVVALLGHSLVVSAAYSIAIFNHDRVDMVPAQVFAEAPFEPSERTHRRAERGARFYALASAISEGGIGLGWAWQPELSASRAWLLAVQQRMDEAEVVLRSALERHDGVEGLHVGLMQVLVAQGKREAALEHGRASVGRHPSMTPVFEATSILLQQEDRIAESIDFARRTLDASPDELTVMRRLSLMLVLHGEGAEIAEGIALVERTLEIAPDNPAAYYWLAVGFGRQDDLPRAADALRRAVELDPENETYTGALLELEGEIGRGAGSGR